MLSNIEIGNRIYDTRNNLGLTLEDVAARVGVARSTIQRYEKGSIKKIKLPVIESIASVLGVNPNWLIGNVENPAPVDRIFDNVIPLPSVTKIPLIGSIACGEPLLAAENLEGEVDLPEQIHADFALRCRGDSMINARIFDGDIVYIRQQDTVDDGQIAAVLIDEEATLKRVHFYPDHIVLEPENPLYRPLVYWEDDRRSIQILGLAVAFTSKVR